MREELNIGQGRFASATSGASMDIGGVNANFRVPRRTDSSTSNPRKMAYVAGGIAVVLVGIVAASSFTTSRHGSGVPVVEADSRPLRVKPDKAGGMAMESGDEALSANEKPGTETLAPAPETPAPAALKKQALEAAQAAAAAEAARLAAAQPPAPVAIAPAAAAPVAAPPVVAPPPVAHAAAPPAKPAPAHVAAVAPNAPKPVAAKSVIAPINTPVNAPVVASPVAGGHSVQLAALVSEPAAQAEWDRIAKKSPALFAGHKPAISKFERDGKTFWRLRTAGFADPAQAAAFCAKAKADGLACLPEKN